MKCELLQGSSRLNAHGGYLLKAGSELKIYSSRTQGRFLPEFRCMRPVPRLIQHGVAQQSSIDSSIATEDLTTLKVKTETREKLVWKGSQGYTKVSEMPFVIHRSI